MSRSRRNLGPGGFTLIELLVTIGIIAVLISILLPVIAKTRAAGYDSATTHRVQAIMTAIDNYYQANHAYPGPLADSEVKQAGTTANGSNFLQKAAGGLLYCTGTENLTLGLMGGLNFTYAKSFSTAASLSLSIGYDYSTVGQGPPAINALTPQRYGPYADPKACGLETPSLAWSDAGHDPQPQSQFAYSDTVIPEFTDAFPDRMPILYIRAQSILVGTRQAGAMPSVAIPGAPAANGQTTNVLAVWDPTQLQPYDFPAAAVGSSSASSITTTDTISGTADAAVLSAYYNYDTAQSKYVSFPHYYFCATDHVTPRQPGGYLLIVAGKDRKFMTSDDRINGIPVQ